MTFSNSTHSIQRTALIIVMVIVSNLLSAQDLASDATSPVTTRKSSTTTTTTLTIKVSEATDSTSKAPEDNPLGNPNFSNLSKEEKQSYLNTFDQRLKNIEKASGVFITGRAKLDTSLYGLYGNAMIGNVINRSTLPFLLADLNIAAKPINDLFAGLTLRFRSNLGTFFEGDLTGNNVVTRELYLNYVAYGFLNLRIGTLYEGYSPLIFSPKGYRSMYEPKVFLMEEDRELWEARLHHVDMWPVEGLRANMAISFKEGADLLLDLIDLKASIVRIPLTTGFDGAQTDHAALIANVALSKKNLYTLNLALLDIFPFLNTFSNTDVNLYDPRSNFVVSGNLNFSLGSLLGDIPILRKLAVFGDVAYSQFRKNADDSANYIHDPVIIGGIKLKENLNLAGMPLLISLDGSFRYVGESFVSIGAQSEIWAMSDERKPYFNGSGKNIMFIEDFSFNQDFLPHTGLRQYGSQISPWGHSSIRDDATQNEINWVQPHGLATKNRVGFSINADIDWKIAAIGGSFSSLSEVMPSEPSVTGRRTFREINGGFILRLNKLAENLYFLPELSAHLSYQNIQRAVSPLINFDQISMGFGASVEAFPMFHILFGYELMSRNSKGGFNYIDYYDVRKGEGGQVVVGSNAIQYDDAMSTLSLGLSYEITKTVFLKGDFTTYTYTNRLNSSQNYSLERWSLYIQTEF